MISLAILSILLSINYCAAQNANANSAQSIGDDQANWQALWTAMSTMRDGRSQSSHVADSTRLSLFDIILRANVQARRQTHVRSGEAEFLYQGDIAMNKRDVVDIVNGGGAGRRKRAVMKKLATRLWQPNKIAYVISSDLGKFAKLAILAAIKHWEDTLPCMGKWRDINNLDSSKRPRDYIRFIKGEGCYSRVGRQRGRQLISIGTGCVYIGVVTHEIGHAMGFWHEQSRTDRDEYIDIHWNNILPAMRFNFEKYTSSRIDDLGVEYDYESVMHYGPKAFSKDGRLSTISIKRNKIKNGVRLGQRYRLSELDKKQARLLYNCNVKSPPCSSNPCLNAGVCSNNGDRYTCRCTSGYTGVRCENREVKSPCSSNPCLNAGVCSNNGDRYTCRCTSGYTGARCENRKAQVCVNDKDTRCSKWGQDGFCNPEKGYGDFMKRRCCATCRRYTSVKACSSSPCLNRGTCTNIGNRYSCTCTVGYTGTRCERRVSPCNSSPCLNSGVCRNNGDSYTCRCTSGYTGARCETERQSVAVCTRNLHSKCETWKRHCLVYNGNRYYSFMKKNCCKTCKEHCYNDKNEHCKRWSENRFCQLQQFKTYMQNNCPLSCGYRC